MTPEQQMTIAFTLLVIAIGIIAWAMHIFEKAEKIKKDTEAIRKEAKRDGIDACCPPIEYGIVKTNSFYDVYATYLSVDGKGEKSILIKRFEFGDDRDFALLETQELLDHLNEK